MNFLCYFERHRISLSLQDLDAMTSSDHARPSASASPRPSYPSLFNKDSFIHRSLSPFFLSCPRAGPVPSSFPSGRVASPVRCLRVSVVGVHASSGSHPGERTVPAFILCWPASFSAGLQSFPLSGPVLSSSSSGKV